MTIYELTDEDRRRHHLNANDRFAIVVQGVLMTFKSRCAAERAVGGR